MTRTLAWINAAVAGLCAGCGVWFVHLAYKAAAEAERIYGHNVDSGAILGFFVAFYFTPNALVFGFTALTMFRRWRARWLAQALAVAWLIGSILTIVFEREIHAL